MTKPDLKDRIIGSGKVSSIVGVVASAAITGAFEYYKATGGSGAWQGYALAGGVAVAGLMVRKRR
jgi:hypothetical protein